MTPIGMSANRRQFLAAAAAVTLTAHDLNAAEPAIASGASQSGDAALQRLTDGNRRFVEHKTLHAHESANWRKHLIGAQHPIATILGCSDSRVPIELVFDQGFGDLFVIRVAGNVIANDVLGSIQYAFNHLKTPLVVVMGHEGCGAVTAALESLAGKPDQAKYIQTLIRHIEPGIRDLDPAAQGEARLSAAVEANVRWSLRQLSQFPESKQALEEKRAALVGAVYDIKTGQVRFLK